MWKIRLKVSYLIPRGPGFAPAGCGVFVLRKKSRK
nr:MAG TPA: hypothetical protein [Caudoviricetes sp.]